MPVLGWWTQMMLVTAGAALVGSFFPGAAAGVKDRLRVARKKMVLGVLYLDQKMDGRDVIGAGSASSSKVTAVSIKRNTSQKEPEPSS